jgi:HD-GYP domain-containing protein (c-di-GMP phosphodiesterase class II)
MADILLLAPERSRARGIRSILRDDGHQVHAYRTTKAWAQLDREIRPELVIAAVDSIGQLLASPAASRRGFPAPILWVPPERANVDPFLEHRLIDRIESPFMAEELRGRADALIRVRRVVHRKPVAPLKTDGERIRTRRGDAPRGLVSRMATLLGPRDDDVETPAGPYLEVEARVAEWADRRDAFEPGHAERVASLCALLGEGLAMDSGESSVLLAAAMLHDIGKVALPVELLHQKSPLDDEQIQWIRSHPRRGADLLRALDPQVDVARTVLYHHERPDGGGYYGKWGEVPRTARALAVAEVYDAMISSRVKDRLPQGRALTRLDELKGDALDTDCVEALTSRLRRRAKSIPLSTPTGPSLEDRS